MKNFVRFLAEGWCFFLTHSFVSKPKGLYILMLLVPSVVSETGAYPFRSILPYFPDTDHLYYNLPDVKMFTFPLGV